MAEIKLPDLKKINGKNKRDELEKKLARSAKLAMLYLILCHRLRAKKQKFTTKEITVEMQDNRGAVYTLVEELVMAGFVLQHKYGAQKSWIIFERNNDGDAFIDQELVDVANKHFEKEMRK